MSRVEVLSNAQMVRKAAERLRLNPNDVFVAKIPNSYGLYEVSTNRIHQGYMNDRGDWFDNENGSR